MFILSLILNGSSCSIIKASCSRFTVDSHLEKFRSCSLCLIFMVAFRHRVFYISHFRRKYLVLRMAVLIPTVPAGGIAALHACNACVLHAYYTHCPCTVQANALNACNFYTQYLRVKLHAVAQLKLINCV